MLTISWRGGKVTYFRSVIWKPCKIDEFTFMQGNVTQLASIECKVRQTCGLMWLPVYTCTLIGLSPNMSGSTYTPTPYVPF